MAKHGLSPLTFFGLNPGLFCTNLFPQAVTTAGRKVPQLGTKVGEFCLHLVLRVKVAGCQSLVVFIT